MRLITIFLEIHKEFMANRFVSRYDETFSMNVLQDRGTISVNFLCALEALNCTFERAYCPRDYM